MPAENSGSRNVHVSGGQVGVISTGDDAQIHIDAIHYSNLPGGDDAVKEKLAALVDRLNQELKAVPGEKREEAEALAETTKDLMKKAEAKKPNKTLINISAQGMKEAAGALASVVPSAVQIVKDIADLVIGMGQ